jgi:glycosyltransferase involved in cell wall biosynthesis
MLSIIIPSRNEKFLVPTIKELLEKAKGFIEIIVVLDGYWEYELPNDERLRIIHRGESRGMRNGINSAVKVARGEYLMKIDAHCMVSEGYDVMMTRYCKDNWVCVPTRKRLDADNWCIQDVGKPDIDYLYLSYPDDPNDFGGKGLNGKLWNEKNADKSLRDKKIDDLMSFQGSCWVMKKDYFYELELMDEENYGTFWNEAQEIGNKCWLSGGRVVRNKHVWYAHLHKGKKHGRGYFLDKRTCAIGAKQTNKWLRNEAWDKQTIPFSWLIEKFMPVPTWDEEKLNSIKKYDDKI